MSKSKDRLPELKKKLNGESQIHHTDEHDTTTAESKEIKKILGKVENVRQSIDGIRGNTSRIKEVLESFKNFPTKETQAELHSLLTASTTISSTVSNKLKDLKKNVNQTEKQNNLDKIKYTQYECLKHEYQEALQENCDVIEHYKEIFKDQLKASSKIVQRNADEEELEKLIESDKPIQIFTDNILIDTEESRQILKNLESRHKELIFIEDSLKEVCELFKQVGSLVEAQQESIDRVEYFSQIATESVEQGAVDLGKAARKKKKNYKLKIYLVIGLIVLIVFIILVLWLA